MHEIEPGVIHVHEAATLSHKSIDRHRAAIQELVAPLQGYALLLDLTRTQRPSVRNHQLWEDSLSDEKLLFAAAYTGDNVLISMSAKMLLSAITGDDAYWIVPSEPLALAAVRHALAGRKAR